MKLSSVLVFHLTESGSGEGISTEQEFEKFKKQHGKTYKDAAATERALDIFRMNLEMIQKHNEEAARGIHSFTMGINHWADKSEKERREYLKLDSNQKFFTNAMKGALHNIQDPIEHLETPQERPCGGKDWRDAGAVGIVRNQGECGSCYSFSSLGALEAAWKIKTDVLPSLSEQQLVDCSGEPDYGNNGCGGGLMETSFEYIRDNGISVEKKYPYTGVEAKCDAPQDSYIKPCEVSGSKSLESGNYADFVGATAKQPVSVAIDGGGEQLQFYKEGVFDTATLDLCKKCFKELNHAVLIVGYGYDDKSHKDYWIVKNSWGAKWGEEGYIRIVRNPKNGPGECGIQSYGVVPTLRSGNTKSPCSPGRYIEEVM